MGALGRTPRLLLADEPDDRAIVEELLPLDCTIACPVFGGDFGRMPGARAEPCPLDGLRLRFLTPLQALVGRGRMGDALPVTGVAVSLTVHAPESAAVFGPVRVAEGRG